ncbi:ABC transporter permease [Amycolatopsis sp. RTGN1]|uniref:ABC transporter permease n=1 Tax=Amycolatopsis ponsaeliensis TaxID=2992142 RepID=UPI00254B16F3|nr:ABC transporter permease [Amycolatopsis sp. RTGN1]
MSETPTALRDAEPQATAPVASGTQRLVLARLRDFALVPGIIAIAVVGQLVNPVFLQYDNVINILQTMSEIALLVLAQTMVLVVGKMDLSLESTFGLAPGVAAWLTVEGGHSLGLLPGWAALPVVLAVGVLVGALNALLIVRFGLSGFVVTLGMLIVLRGLLTGISGGQTFFGLPEEMLYLGTTLWAGVPASIWVCVLLFAGGIVLLGYTRFGRSLYAIGGNPDAAKAAGIRTDRIVWIVLISASALAALGGLLLSGRLASVASGQGNGYIFTVFAAAVIGGVSLNGGRGTLFGAFTGILLLYMIQNALTLAGVPAQWIGALNGTIILVALVMSRITSGKQQN